MNKKWILVFCVLGIVLFFIGCSTGADMIENGAENAADESSPVLKVDESTPGLEGFGAAGAAEDTDLSLEKMLRYAIEDEYLARQEYSSIMETFGEQTPFSNIIKSEETHILWLTGLYETYELDIPEDQALAHVVIPDSIQEALETGIQAEINNIAMYETFLEQDLPDDVRDVFTALRDASKKPSGSVSARCRPAKSII